MVMAMINDGDYGDDEDGYADEDDDDKDGQQLTSHEVSKALDVGIRIKESQLEDGLCVGDCEYLARHFKLYTYCLFRVIFIVIIEVKIDFELERDQKERIVEHAQTSPQ